MSDKPDSNAPKSNLLWPVVSLLTAIMLLLALDWWVGNQRAAGADAPRRYPFFITLVLILALVIRALLLRRPTFT